MNLPPQPLRTVRPFNAGSFSRLAANSGLDDVTDGGSPSVNPHGPGGDLPSPDPVQDNPGSTRSSSEAANTPPQPGTPI